CFTTRREASPTRVTRTVPRGFEVRLFGSGTRLQRVHACSETASSTAAISRRMWVLDLNCRIAVSWRGELQMVVSLLHQAMPESASMSSGRHEPVRLGSPNPPSGCRSGGPSFVVPQSGESHPV